MSKRIFVILLTLGLSVSLLAATPGTTAGEGQDLVGLAPNSLYLPWVHNGDVLDGEGRWYGTVTVQNLEAEAVQVVIKTASEATTSFQLSGHASRTFSPDNLRLATGGEGVAITASWADPYGGMCKNQTTMVSHASANGVDHFAVVPAGAVLSSVKAVSQGPTTFNQSGDYVVGGIGSAMGAIHWAPGGDEPDTGTAYEVSYLSCERLPTIGAVEKHSMPALATEADTGGTHDAVDSYSAISGFDLPEVNAAGTYESFLPIVQTNTGWNSIIHVTNFAPEAAGVMIRFYPAEGQDSGADVEPVSDVLASGETLTVDLSARGVPDGWVGSASITTNQALVLTQVDRVKPVTSMALTNVAAPYLDVYAGAPAATLERYAPLVFRDYNFWNTGINITNLTPAENTVEISYFAQDGSIVAQDSVTLPARGMKYVYRPALTASGPSAITGAVLSSATGWFYAVVDEVKYLGLRSEGAGHAMSYPVGAPHCGFPGANLSLPLLQKGDETSGLGDTSGINVFNPDSAGSVSAEIMFYNKSGEPAAPTHVGPLVVTLASHQGATLYSLDYDAMPEGFQGSATIAVTQGSGAIVGVSNNVNYEVDGDGGAVFNLLSSYGSYTSGCGSRDGTSFTINPTTQSVQVDSVAEIAVTAVDENGLPLPGVPVKGTVTAGPNTGWTATTTSPGTLAFSHDGGSGEPGTDTVTVWVDLNNNGAVDPGEEETATITWTPVPEMHITLEPPAEAPVVGDTASLTATVTDESGNPVADVPIHWTVGGPNAATAVPGDGDETTGSQGTATVAYSQTRVGTDTVTACVDLDADQVCEPGEPVDTANVTWTAGSAMNVAMTGPASQTVGTPAEFTATLTDAYGNPVANTEIMWVVTGPNQATANPTTGNSMTDATGEATFKYTNTAAGQDTVTACVDLNDSQVCGDGEPADAVDVIWTAGAPADVTVTGDAYQLVGSPANFLATVTDAYGNLVVDGTVVSWTVEGEVAGSLPDPATATSTTTSGVAHFSYTNHNIAVDSVTASAGPASDSAPIIWVGVDSGATGEPAQVVVTGPDIWTVGVEATFVASVTDANGLPVANTPVAWEVIVLDGSRTPDPASGVSMTNAVGQATFSYVQTAHGTDRVEATAGTVTGTATIHWED